jgi:CheY-like chemotaxis protein
MSAAQSAGAKILLVDDDLDFLEINRLLLEAEGYRVVCHAEAEDAFRALAADPPDLVITDLMMGRLDSGFSLARRLKADPRFAAIPVLIISGIARERGYDFSPNRSGDLAAMPADAWLEKPADPPRLLETVRTLLARPPRHPPGDAAP